MMQALPGGKQADPMRADWIAGIRDAALAEFGRHGQPTPRLETWRHTNLRPFDKTRFHTLPRVTATGMSEAALAPKLLDKPAGRLVFVNGRMSPTLSFAGEFGGPVGLESIVLAVTGGSPLLRAHLGTVACHEGAEHAMTAQNLGTFDGGAVLFVPAGLKMPGPIELVFVGAPTDVPVKNTIRNMIVVGRGAELTVVERYLALDFRDQPYMTNAVTELVAAENAQVRHVRIQDEGPAALHLGVLGVRQSAHSRVESDVIQVGAKLGRSDVQVALAEPGASCRVDGLYVGTGEQHLDQNSVIEHQAPHCDSSELYKGVLDQRSSGVFRGRIEFHEGAIKSSTQQLNRNLLLSPHASASSKPQLEIDNDDVKATHGSTIGQLDDSALFYMRARGIDAETARGLLTWGFVREVVDALPVPELRTWLARRLSDRLTVPDEE